MNADTRILIENGDLSLELAPAWGGRVARLRTVRGNTDILVPLEASTFDPLDWPRAGTYPLAPYSNRIENAQLWFGDERYALPAHPRGQPHTLHGVAHTLRWDVARATTDAATLRTEYEGEHWPWPFRADQSFLLHGPTLTQRLALTNLGVTPMPAGLGLHPFFRIDPSSTASFAAREAWAIGADCLPSGDRSGLRDAVVVRAADVLTQEYVGYYSGWNGQAEIVSDVGVLSLSASDSLSHLVVFAPVGGRFLCLEPVSHVANGFNLAAAGCPGTGTRVLAPGETMLVSIDLTWTPRQP